MTAHPKRSYSEFRRELPGQYYNACMAHYNACMADLIYDHPWVHQQFIRDFVDQKWRIAEEFGIDEVDICDYIIGQDRRQFVQQLRHYESLRIRARME